GGTTDMRAPGGYALARKTAEFAVIAAAAENYVGWTANSASYNGDRRVVREAVRGKPAEYRAHLEAEARRIVSSPRFREIAKRGADAVLEAGGVLRGEPLERALRARP